MNYLKHVEVSRKYNVSKPTVTRWVELATQGRNNLQLVEVNGKMRILDNTHNEAELLNLAGHALPYKSHSSQKVVDIHEDFYKIFDIHEIVDIINSLKFKKLIQHKYSYLTIGAKCWDERYNLKASPLMEAVINLLDLTIADLLYLTDDATKINLIDIGPGNGHPAKHFVGELRKKNLFNSYVAVDISDEMNTIASSNMSKWHKGVKIVTHKHDVEVTRFNELFLEQKGYSDKISNIIFHIECIYNHEDRVQVLKNIRSGMIENDLLVLTFSIDTPHNRSLLNYIKDDIADRQQSWIPQLLGIDTDNCEFQMNFNGDLKCKIKTITLDKDYIINFKLFGKDNSIKLYSGEEISIWRHYITKIQSFFSEINKAELEVVNYKLDKKLSYAMVICRPKRANSPFNL